MMNKVKTLLKLLQNYVPLDTHVNLDLFHNLTLLAQGEHIILVLDKLHVLIVLLDIFVLVQLFIRFLAQLVITVL